MNANSRSPVPAGMPVGPMSPMGPIGPMKESTAPAESEDLLQRLGADVAAAGGELAGDPELAGAIGATMFDLPTSEDHTVTVLLPRKSAQRAPSQALVRIKSRKDGDGRSYLGIITAGPFAEPDS